MIKPNSIKEGDIVSVISPSGIVNIDEVKSGINILKDWGLRIKAGKHIYKSYNNFAGNDKQRLEDLQNALDDENVKAIFCTRGGYGLSRIVGKLNFEKFITKPKWLIGFSDITVLHSYLNNKLGIQSIHGPVLRSFSSLTNTKSLFYLHNILFNNTISYNIDIKTPSIRGEIDGILIGGNLSILHNLRKTPYDIIPDNKILFIEDVNEYLYHLDRMLMSFELSGVFSKLKGIIAGGFTDMKDQKTPFGKNAQEIIYSFAKEYNIPFAWGFPAGHQSPNFPLVLGAKIMLKISNRKLKIYY